MSELCTYCGDNLECYDHFIPTCYARVKPNNQYWDLVPCCNHCNHLKGSKLFETWHEVYEYLIERYHRKFARILRAPDWHKDDFIGMDRSLEEYVQAEQNLKTLINAKIGVLLLAARKSHQNAVQTPSRHGAAYPDESQRYLSTR